MEYNFYTTSVDDFPPIRSSTFYVVRFQFPNEEISIPGVLYRPPAIEKKEYKQLSADIVLFSTIKGLELITYRYTVNIAPDQNMD